MTAQNTDVFFQAREAGNPYYLAVPEIVQEVMDQLASRVGRQYRLFEFVGAPDADSVIVLMGFRLRSSRRGGDRLVARGQKVGMVQSCDCIDRLQWIALWKCCRAAFGKLASWTEPKSRVRSENRSIRRADGSGRGMGVTSSRNADPWFVVGIRIVVEEFTPARVIGIFRELEAAAPRRHFNGRHSRRVTRMSLPWDDNDWHEPDDVIRSVFYGLGSDGTVGANKNSVKIVGENKPLYAQGYFVYDSK